MRSFKLILSALLTIGFSTAGYAQSCTRPSQVRNAHITSYHSKNAVNLCLTKGRSIKIRALAANKVRIERGTRIGDYRIVSPRKFTFGQAQVKIQGISTSHDNLILSVEVNDQTQIQGPSGIIPRVCPQLEGGFCYQVYAPVCGQDPLGTIKMYTNGCYANLDCAVLVDDALCGL